MDELGPRSLSSDAPARPSFVSLYYFTGFLAFGLYLPFFAPWLEEQGLPKHARGAILALLPIASIVGPPIIGVIADRFGLRGTILRKASLLNGFSFLGLGVWATHRLDSPFLDLLTLGVLVSVFALFRAPVVLLADVLTVELLGPRSERYALFRVFGSFGFLLAALFGGRFLSVSSPWAIPFVTAAAWFATYLVARALPLRASRSERARTPHLGRTLAVRLLPLLATAFFAYLAHSAYDGVFSLHLRARGATDAEIGVAWALGVAAEVALMFAAPRILSIIGGVWLLRIGLIGGTLRWALIAAVNDVTTLLALQALHAFSFACFWLAGLRLASDEAGEDLAQGQGLFTAAIAFGSVLGQLGWNTLFDARGGEVVFAGAAVAAALGLCVSSFVRPASPT